MAFTNSGLVKYTKISPNRTKNRNHAIDTITIHCVVGQASVQSLGEVFAPTSRQASSNYGVGYDGSIGMYVEEKDRSWCSSSSSNDHRAVTIEVASDTTAPYAVNDKAYAALIELVADICKRNGIEELKWKADKSLIGQVDKQNMTVHRWFASTACPGDYLYSRMGDIAAKVNALLGSTASTETGNEAVESNSYPTIRSGSTGSYVKIAQEYLNNWGASLEVDGEFGNLTLASVKKFQKEKNLEVDGIVGPITWAALMLYKDKQKTTAEASYVVRVEIPNLNIRKGPGTNYDRTGSYTGKGSFTIVETKTGTGSTNGWGKLKSGAGWISLDFAKRV